MLVWLLISAIIGAIVSGITGIGLLGWIAGGFLFLTGLPGALIGGFIYDMTSYKQDREDRRAYWSDINADLREMERQDREDMRYYDYLDRMEDIESRRGGNTYNIDARSVHYHNHTSSESTTNKISGRRKNS